MSFNRTSFNNPFTKPNPFRQRITPEHSKSSPSNREYHVYIRRGTGPQIPEWTRSVGGLETLLLKMYEESFADCVKQTRELLEGKFPTRLMYNAKNLSDQDLYEEVKELHQDVVLEKRWWQFNPKWTKDFWGRITVFSVLGKGEDIQDGILPWFQSDFGRGGLGRHNWWGPYEWSRQWTRERGPSKVKW